MKIENKLNLKAYGTLLYAFLIYVHVYEQVFKTDKSTVWNRTDGFHISSTRAHHLTGVTIWPILCCEHKALVLSGRLVFGFHICAVMQSADRFVLLTHNCQSGRVIIENYKYITSYDVRCVCVHYNSFASAQNKVKSQNSTFSAQI